LIIPFPTLPNEINSSTNEQDSGHLLVNTNWAKALLLFRNSAVSFASFGLATACANADNESISFASCSTGNLRTVFFFGINPISSSSPVKSSIGAATLLAFLKSGFIYSS